jgi:drug/metabolite transporter (DMT)-like permease
MHLRLNNRSRERALLAAPGVCVAFLWTFTALRFRPSIDLLLLLLVLLCGGGLLAQMLLSWSVGRSSPRLTLASCAVGAVMIVFSAVGLSYSSESASAPLRATLSLLALAAIAYRLRVQRQELAAASGEAARDS